MTIRGTDRNGVRWTGERDGNTIDWNSSAGHHGTETLDADGQCESVTGNLSAGKYNADRSGWDDNDGAVPCDNLEED